jgi:hypothetical protein
VVRTLSSYETSLCSLPARVPVLERDLHGGFHGFGTAQGVDDRLESAPHLVRGRWVSSSSGSLLKRWQYPHATCALTRDRRVHLGVVVVDAERGRSAGAIQVPTTRRVVQIASLAAGDSSERIESPAEGAPSAYGGWGWRADGG